MTRVPGDQQLRLLHRLCRELTAKREQVDELAERRNDLIRALHAAGRANQELAEITGLSAGRITQIASPSG